MNPVENVLFCRIGTKRMLEILTRITEGKGELQEPKQPGKK
jgi:NADH:ubiquinone oxidoreductase subunit F (NADH-binding)